MWSLVRCFKGYSHFFFFFFCSHSLAWGMLGRTYGWISQVRAGEGACGMYVQYGYILALQQV